MEVVFLPDGKDDLSYWIATGNKSILKKMAQLIDDIRLHHYSGIGKPEPLNHNHFVGWSRRINKEHRLIYEVTDDIVLILTAKWHYT